MDRQFTRRDFLKTAGATIAALALKNVPVALKGSPGVGVAHAQEGALSPELTEQYKQKLDERFNVNGAFDPIALRFTEKGIQELKTQSGLDVTGDGTFRAPRPKMFADAVYFRTEDWRAKNGEFDPQGVADYLAKQWGPENLGPGRKEGPHFFFH